MELAQIAILSFAWRAFAKVLCSFPHQCLHSYPLGRLMTGNHARHCTSRYSQIWYDCCCHTVFHILTAKLAHLQLHSSFGEVSAELLSWWPHPSPRKMESSKRTIWSFALKTKKKSVLLFSVKTEKNVLQAGGESKIRGEYGDCILILGRLWKSRAFTVLELFKIAAQCTSFFPKTEKA